jgi:predicted MFS family arabinose efflux permease
MSAGTSDGYGEFRKGWPVVLASMLGIALGLSPLPFYTIGVFAPHLAHAFGWSQGQIMGGLTVTTLMVLWAGPAVGWLATRWPVRRVVLGSLVLFSLAFMSLGLSSGSLIQYYLTFAAIAVLGAGTLPITWTKAVNHRFDRRKGLALGISLMGTGIFGFFSKGLTAWLIVRFGWRGGFVGIGLLPLVIALPVALALFHDTGPMPAAEGAPALQDGGMTVAQVLRDRRFWTMAMGFLIVAFALAGPVPNLEKILTLARIAPGTIIGLTSLIGLSALSGRLIGGWLVDRLWAPGVAFVILSAPALSCWLLAGAVLTPTLAAAAIGLIGFALGVEYDLMAFFIARYFGMRSYTAIYGILYVFFSLGSGFGPLVFGLDFDRHGSFHLSLLGAAAVLLTTGTLFLTLGKYRLFAPQPASAAAA